MTVVKRLADAVNSAIKLDWTNEDMFNKAVREIQDVLGISTGDVAGVHFSGDEYLNAITDVEKRDVMLEYIRTEIMMNDDEDC
jgi:hypothetical protein